MRFPPSLLDDIRDRIPVSAVVGRKVQLKKQGREMAGLSPFTAEKTPSFFVNDAKRFYHCFSSGKHGDIFTFLMETEGLSFPEAVERLADEAGIPLPKPDPRAEERERERATLYDVIELAAQWFERQLQETAGGPARAYIERRGISVQAQRQFRLGYAPGNRSGLKDFLAGKDVTPDQMAEAGLVISGDDIPVAFDRFRDRLMFPITDARGRVIAFGGRAMSEDQPAKYLNSPETPLFHKGATLFNIQTARAAAREDNTVYVAEGYMDVIALAEGGFPASVAPLGTALTETQLGHLWRMSDAPVLCFDGDKAGLRAAFRAVELALPQLAPGKTVSFALLPEGKDPDDILRQDGAEVLGEVLSRHRPLVDMLWGMATESHPHETPEQRAALEKELRALVRRIGDADVRRHYGEAVGARLSRLFSRGGEAGPARPAGGRSANSDRARRSGGAMQPFGRDRPGWTAGAGAAPASTSLRQSALLSPQRTAQRRQLILLAALMNHPQLLAEFAEDLAEISFADSDLDSARQRLLDVAAGNPRSDPARSLHGDLEQAGLERVVERINLMLAEGTDWFADPEAADSDAEIGIRHILALHRRSETLHRELTAAERAFQSDMTDTNWLRLQSIKSELDSHEGAEARIEGFGAGSGRMQRGL
ncbi:MAG: DNA primase [Pseudomonadota bacterium]